MDQELSKLAKDILEKAQDLVERAEGLEAQQKNEISPRTLHLIDANKRWMALHNSLRSFGHILAWQYWFDFHGGGVLNHRYEGHDARLSFDLKYLLTKLNFEKVLGHAITIDGGTAKTSGPIKIIRSNTKKDMLRVATQGIFEINGLSSDFTLAFDLIVFAQRGEAVLTLGTGCSITIEGPIATLRDALKKQITSELARRLANLRLFQEGGVQQLGMIFHSAHVDHFLTLFFSEKLPAQPVGHVVNGVDTSIPPEGWEDMILSISDDYVQQLVTRELIHVGWFHYEPDPHQAGQYVLPIVYRMDISRGGTVDWGWFGSYTWTHNSTHWPKLWLRMRGHLRDDGVAEIKSTASLAGANKSETERSVAEFYNVKKLKSVTTPEKSFSFRIAFKDQN